jgi:hypothetical protein
MRRHLIALSALTVVLSPIKTATAESFYAHAYRLCMTNYAHIVNPASNNAFFWRGARKVCADFAKHPNPNQLADFENTYDQNGTSSAGADAAAAFLLGVASGFIGSYGGGGSDIGHGGHMGASHFHEVHAAHHRL